MAEKESAGNRVARDRPGSQMGYRPPFIIIGYWRQVIWIPEDAVVFMPIRLIRIGYDIMEVKGDWYGDLDI